jgi:hypothetical protein
MKYSLLHLYLWGKCASVSNRVPVKNIVSIAFCEPIIYDTLEITSSRPRPNIFGDSQREENKLSSLVIIFGKSFSESLLSPSSSFRASSTRLPCWQEWAHEALTFA